MVKIFCLQFIFRHFNEMKIRRNTADQESRLTSTCMNLTVNKMSYST